MLRTRLVRVATVVVLIMTAEACTDGLTDINANPNAPTDVPAQFLLPQAIQSSVRSAFGSLQMASHTGIWVQHFVQIQYAEEEQGQVRAASMEGLWTGYYSGPLKDIELVIEKGSVSGDGNVEGVGRIWKSWIFHIVTDLWGDVPYTEALQGEAIAVPVYDAQATVYNGLFADLTLAAGMVGSGSSDFGSGDILYENNFTRWRRFANSLRMRLAMRLSRIDPVRGRAEFAAAYAAGGFTSNADNAFLEYPGAPYENPFYVDWLTRDDHGASGTMIDALVALNDPRLELYALPARRDGAYRGHSNGLEHLPPGQSLSFFSRIGGFWRGSNSASTPSAVMTYSEVLFLQAEAAAMGWISGDPEALYREAIEANMRMYSAYGEGPSSAEIDAYLDQPEVAYAGLESIHLQKWIALWMNGQEAYSNWRRVDSPNLVTGRDLIVSRIPVRFSYPDSEQSLNNSNLDAALARQGGGLDLVTPVWWDVN